MSAYLATPKQPIPARASSTMPSFSTHLGNVVDTTDKTRYPSSAIFTRSSQHSDSVFQHRIDRRFHSLSSLLINMPSASKVDSEPAKNDRGDQENALNRGELGDKAPWWVASWDEDGFYSIGALLFLFGFLCPPLWWLGAFWPRHASERGGKMAERWQQLNFLFSIGFSVMLVIALIVAAVIYSRNS